jgi:hypothetical protein
VCGRVSAPAQSARPTPLDRARFFPVQIQRRSSTGPPMRQRRQHRPLLADIAPEFAADLERELRAQDDHELAAQAPYLRVLSFCGCGDYQCASFTTREPSKRNPERQAETVPIEEVDGMVNVDIIDGVICYVEVLYRADLRSLLEAGFARDGSAESRQ